MRRALCPEAKVATFSPCSRGRVPAVADVVDHRDSFGIWDVVPKAEQQHGGLTRDEQHVALHLARPVAEVLDRRLQRAGGPTDDDDVDLELAHRVGDPAMPTLHLGHRVAGKAVDLFEGSCQCVTQVRRR